MAHSSPAIYFIALMIFVWECLILTHKLLGARYRTAEARNTQAKHSSTNISRSATVEVNPKTISVVLVII